MCTICKKEYATSGNTSNLKDRIKRKHPEEYDKNEGDSSPKKVCGQPTLFHKSMTYGKSSSRKKVLDNKVALMIATDFQPYS